MNKYDSSAINNLGPKGYPYLIHTYGYICDECYKELEVSNLCVRDFMETRKEDVFRKAWIDYLNNEFPFK
jgi:hypothetical protein